MSFNKIIDKYLSKQNLSNWEIVQKDENEKFSNVIVIPAICEFENIAKLIESLLSNNLQNINKTLALFVINNKVNDSNEIKNDNLNSIKYIEKLPKSDNHKLKFGYIDCFSDGKGLPEKDAGAGLARKIGMDLALNLFDFSNKEKKVLISLDSDCLVSENYIKEITLSFNQNNFDAAVINFVHQLSENAEQNLAIINYEIFIRYYVLGLKFANSKFSFHTIGSAFAISPEIYVKVGGMNKKKAGEDFYFLQKVAKVAEIKKIANATVFPSSRISWRVPFGTGPRIKRFLSIQQNEYLLYSPKSFKILKDWLLILNNSDENSKSTKILSEAKLINTEIYNFLISQNFEENWTNILKNSKTQKQLNQNIRNWMDGFKTLKLIHHLRDFAFPNENIFESVNQILKFYEEEKIECLSNIKSDLENQMLYLEKLRKLT